MAFVKVVVAEVHMILCRKIKTFSKVDQKKKNKGIREAPRSPSGLFPLMKPADR